MILLYWAWRLGVFLVGLTPRRLSFNLAGWIGYLTYYLMPLRRRVAQENLAHVLGKDPDDPAVRRVVRESFQNYVRLLRDTMLYSNMSLEEIGQRVTIHTGGNLEKALALGKGAIVVSAHFGNMDMAGAALASQFAPVALVSETLRPQQLMDWLVQVRAKNKVVPYPYDSAPRKIIEAVKRNEIAAMLIDFGVTHHFDITTVPVNFFGAETNFPAGPAQLALLTGAAIVVGHTRIGTHGHIDAYTYPPIIAQRTGDRRRDMQTTMQKIAELMENFIRHDPGQWYIFRPMWRDGASATRKIPSLSKPSPPRNRKPEPKDLESL